MTEATEQQQDVYDISDRFSPDTENPEKYRTTRKGKSPKSGEFVQYTVSRTHNFVTIDLGWISG